MLSTAGHRDLCRNLIAALWLLGLALACPVTASPASSAWLLKQVAEKESTLAALVWLKHHIGGERYVPKEVRGLPISLHAAGARPVPANDLAKAPYAAIGRLFSTGRNQEVSSCTAFFVKPGTLMTAAHCVIAQDGRWKNDLVFVSGLGTEWLKAEGVQCVVVPRAWGEIEVSPLLPLDYAVMKITAGDRQAALSLDVDGGPGPVNIIGYRSGCCGDQMLELAKDSSAIRRNVDHYASEENPMGMGSSGSPWIHQVSGKVISLNAQYPDLGSNRMNGPRFNQRTAAMLRHIEDHCP